MLGYAHEDTLDILGFSPSIRPFGVRPYQLERRNISEALKSLIGCNGLMGFLLVGMKASGNHIRNLQPNGSTV